ncbi:DUF4114 domain-containing protein, partial [Nostoc sp. CHAB 5715]|uniref:DUF4114 domain-containing protein n=1 Tax=Nostoc sp. CHAB 5715 TaxID=2780400 RepID=UPI001E499294
GGGVFSASFNGARLVRANSTSSGVTIRLLQQTATITLPLFPDEVVEGLETFTYTLSPVPGYDFVPGENAITFTINDTATPPPPILPTINQLSDSVFQLEGSDQPKLQISLIERNSNQVNELGVFIVDDDKGTINGIEPNSTGYAQAALDRAELIFSAISNLPTGFNQTNSTSLLELNSGDKLGFLLVENSTIDAVRSGVTSLSEVIFAEPSTQKVETLDDGNYLISWEDPKGNDVSDFKDLVIKALATNQSLPLGAGLQGNPEGELIDLRDITGQVRAEFELYREAAFDNLIGFYKVADADGGIDADGNGTIDIRPGDPGYAKAAVQGRVAGLDLTVNNQGTATFTTNLNGGSIYAPFIIANSKPEAIVDDNPNNDPAVYFAFLGANPSNYDHIRLLGNNTWGFEDLPLGGDKDYNDVIVQANFNLI